MLLGIALGEGAPSTGAAEGNDGAYTPETRLNRSAPAEPDPGALEDPFSVVEMPAGRLVRRIGIIDQGDVNTGRTGWRMRRPLTDTGYLELFGSADPGDRQKVCVLPQEGAKGEDLAITIRDAQVMSRILDHVLKRPRWIGGVFYDYGDFFQEDSHPIQATYVQGYGVLFFVEVDFSLVQTPKAEQEQQPAEAEEGHVDPVWRQAELGMLSSEKSGDPQQLDSPGVKAEHLKTELTKVLRHASNIRNMKAEEWVVISVTGEDHSDEGLAYIMAYTITPHLSEEGQVGLEVRVDGREVSDANEVGGYYLRLRSPRSCVLTLRAKKSDVDAFGKGELNYEEFNQRVESSLVEIPLADDVAEQLIGVYQQSVPADEEEELPCHNRGDAKKGD
jgi:hypothetical protein